MDALAFQKHFILVVCEALESRFDEIHIVDIFWVLGPTNISLHRVGLANWGVVDLEVLYAQNDVKHKFNGRRISASINSGAIKRRIFCLNCRQQQIGWIRSFKDLGAMIT